MWKIAGFSVLQLIKSQVGHELFIKVQTWDDYGVYGENYSIPQNQDRIQENDLLEHKDPHKIN